MLEVTAPAAAPEEGVVVVKVLSEVAAPTNNQLIIFNIHKLSTISQLPVVAAPKVVGLVVVPKPPKDAPVVAAVVAVVLAVATVVLVPNPPKAGVAVVVVVVVAIIT